MDQLIPSFNRVQLGLDAPSGLISRLPQLESAILSGDTTISPSGLLLLLDRPSPASVASSLAELQSDRATLLRRAIYTPAALSPAEIDLLRCRFWPLHEYNSCLGAYASALAKLESDTSEEHTRSTFNRLRELREKLAGEEEKAFGAALQEWGRRMMLGTGIPKAEWGYAVYYDPDADNDDFQSRVTASLQWARDYSAVAKEKGQASWALHRIQWPAGGTDARFERLRRDFQTVRDALPEGILRNVFLVADRDSVHSVLHGARGGGFVDDMWAWAVDPEHRHRDGDEQEREPAAYPGYMRVRLQQLVNNFYAARQGSEMVPLETLWACAQRSYERAFVSVREEDFQKWVGTRDVGSCLRQRELWEQGQGRRSQGQPPI
ncbi:hypothetical protein LX32DRAFT_241983 [Colletotrichum zoysiae]|uniref:Uncharacterized protein n=1 Tax=Colletotrichum zoysiae TaxID=1216348 RepID=A0AAD9H385_9PEZI|nr:hypothetical protein LX32DRAFT_241983 [Colletotrichum zoysiae]